MCAIIVAAGASLRMGGDDKLFLNLNRKPVLYWSILAFEANSLVDEIVIVLKESNIARGRRLVNRAGFGKVTGLVLGGMRRRDSVSAGLEKAGQCSLVLIHDGARPLIGDELINLVLNTAALTGAAIPAVPVTDTIKTSRDGMVAETLPRNKLFAVQTPQAFDRIKLLQACRGYTQEVTDDAQLYEKFCGSVSLVPGTYDNIKITNPPDLELARILIKKRGD